MGRPVFPCELGDPDFCWLISNFQENFPQYSFVQSSSLPVVFIGERDYEQEIVLSEEAEAEEEEISGY